ncbi:hypothetical protein GQ53DRAFT_837056 [Thozetella sp. PMI_491]|nr:hypothetical protein GQ53DRAFT_837056 [Thozetella sp. PMI_491]
MLASTVTSALVWALGLASVAAGDVSSGMVPAYRVRSAPGMSDMDTIMNIHRALSQAAIEKRDTLLKNTTSISKAWNDAILYKHDFDTKKNVAGGNLSASASVSISCKTCYTKANLTAELAFGSGFNISSTLKNLTQEVKQEAKNITGQALTLVEGVFDEIGDIVEDFFDDGEVDLDHIQFPTVPFDFNIDVPEIPDVTLKFTFDEIEVYMELEAALSAKATYEMNLYTSKTEAGIKINDDLLLGVVAVVDLIIDAHAEIDISSGFHLKLNDGLSLTLAMFSKNTSDINFPGGQFEFLPVTISTDGAVLSATLRVGIHAGIAFKTDELSVFGHSIGIGAGVELSAFANVANFITNITAAPISIGAREEDKCALNVAEYYEFAIGGAVGATVNVGTKTWGPMPDTTTPIFYTTLAEACASKKTQTTTASATTTSAPKMVRQDGQALVTKTISTTEVFSGQVCSIPGLINCPASLQQTTTFPTVRTLVTAVPANVDPTFPPTTFDAVSSTKDFGRGAKDVSSSAGAPTSYTPPPTSTASGTTGIIPQATAAIGDAVHAAEGWLNGSTGGVSNKIILGVSVGVGVPVLIGLISLVCCLCRRRKYAPVPRNEGGGGGVTNIYVSGAPAGNGAARPLMSEPYDPHKSSNVSVSVNSR